MRHLRRRLLREDMHKDMAAVPLTTRFRIQLLATTCLLVLRTRVVLEGLSLGGDGRDDDGRLRANSMPGNELLLNHVKVGAKSQFLHGRSF
jgi:hypothetical protein